MRNKITTLIILIIIYLLLKHIIPFGNYIIYPINLLVTFLHEFGHGFFALITGWSVHWLIVNSDWSWLTTTSWWIRDIVVAWGYLWSAIFWNILLYIWFKKEKLSKNVIYLLSWLMIFSAVFWFNWIISSLIILTLSGLLIFSTKYTKNYNLILQFLGISSIIYIIEDFNVWPSSDLEKFSTFLPNSVWMIIWLILVILITWYNLKLILKK